MSETRSKAATHEPDDGLLTEVMRRLRDIEKQTLAQGGKAGKWNERAKFLVAASVMTTETRATELANRLGIELPRARQLVRSLNSLDSLASDIADALEWDHEGDARKRAEQVAGISDWSPEGLAAKFVDRGPDYALASAYLSVTRLIEATERGDLIYTIGELADVARNLLGAGEQHKISAQNSNNARAGWGWRTEVVQRAFELRAADLRSNPKKSRRQSIMDMEDEIRALYDEKGAARNKTKLSKDAYNTIERWFIQAGVK